MDRLGRAIATACYEAMEEMQQEVHQLKDEHRAAVTLLQNQLQDINTRSDEQSAYIRTLEQELQRQNEALTSLRGSMERDNARVNALDAQTDELRDRLLAVTQTTLRVIDHVRPTAHADTPDGIEGHLPV